MGLHVKEGSKIWSGWRTFESSLLAALERLNKDKKTIATQVDQVCSIFKRQLAVPLIGMEEALKEYETWAEKMNKKDALKEIDKSYQNALKMLEERKPFEESIVTQNQGTEPD